MAKKKRTRSMDDHPEKIASGQDPMEPKMSDPSLEENVDERYLSKRSNEEQDDPVEQRYLTRSRSNNNEGSSRLWGYKNGDPKTTEEKRNVQQNEAGNDRELRNEQELDEGPIGTSKRIEKEDEADKE